MKPLSLVLLAICSLFFLNACAATPTPAPSAVSAIATVSATATRSPNPSPSPSPNAAPSYTPSHTPTPWPSATAAPSSTPTRAPYAACPDAPLARLAYNQVIMVNIEPAASSRVRLNPGLNARITGVLEPGQLALTTGGPQCASELVWWQIRAGNLKGWVAEGDFETPWVLPLRSSHLALAWNKDLSLGLGYFDLFNDQLVSPKTIGPLFNPGEGASYSFAINLSSDGNHAWAYGGQVQNLGGGRYTQTNPALLLLDTHQDQTTALPLQPGSSPQIFWAPNGQYLALVWRDQTSGAATLQVLLPDGAPLSQPLDYARTTNDGTDPLWAPDSSRLLYTSTEQDCRLISIRPDGGEKSCLAGESIAEAGWSPDSRAVLVLPSGKECSWQPGADGPQTVCSAPAAPPVCRLAVIASTGGEAVCLSQDPASAPQWTPDSSAIAFLSENDAGHLIQVKERSGALRFRLDQDRSTRLYWSPDGSSLAYDCGGLCLVNANGGDQRAYLTKEAANWRLVRAVWSPDGQRLAAHFDGGLTGAPLYILNPKGLLQISQRAGFTGELTWSPDGYFLAFLDETLMPQIVDAAGLHEYSVQLEFGPLWMGWTENNP